MVREVGGRSASNGRGASPQRRMRGCWCVRGSSLLMNFFPKLFCVSYVCIIDYLVEIL